MFVPERLSRGSGSAEQLDQEPGCARKHVPAGRAARNILSIRKEPACVRSAGLMGD